MPEKVEQAHIVQLLRAIGASVYVLGTRRPRGDFHGTRQTAGLPDVLSILPRGLGVLFVEVKATGGRLRPEQAQFRDQCGTCAEPYRVHHVVGGLSDVMFHLMHLGLLKAEDVPHYRMRNESHA